MHNYITANIEFYFKGEKIAAAIILDLDQHMQNTGGIPDLYPLLASAINLDFYSYEYEMMQSETITFSQAQGIVTDYLDQGLLDINAFESAWHEYQLIKALQQIAQQYLSINDLQQQPALKKALREAWQLGYTTKHKIPVTK